MINSIQAAIFLPTTDVVDVGTIAHKYFPNLKIQTMNVAEGVRSELQGVLVNQHIVRIVSDPSRLDIFAMSPLLPNSPAGTLLPFRELLQDIDGLVPTIAKDHGATRLSIVTQALERTIDAKTGLTALPSWLPDVQLPHGTTDVEIRFNVPQEVDGLLLNRNKRFQIALLQPLSSTGQAFLVEAFTVKVADVNMVPTESVEDFDHAWRALTNGCEDLLENGFAG